MLFRRMLLAGVAALAAGAPAAGAATPAVRLAAGFERGATLGAASALRVDLRIDPRRAPSPVTEVRLLYPGSLGVVSSGLGLAACRRPAIDFEQVLVTDEGSNGCSPNAVMAFGELVAEVRLSDGQVIPEYGTVALLSGPVADGVLGLVVQIDGQRPFGGRLVLAGHVAAAPQPYGGAIVVRFPVVPTLVGVADVALTDLRLNVGDPRIRYVERVRGRTVRYRPEGVVLPNRCPRGAFRFRVRLGFLDGSTRTVRTTLRCPPPAPAAAPAR